MVRRLLGLLLTAAMLVLLVPAGFAAAADDIKVTLDGDAIPFDAQPFTENDRTLVPVRVLAEKLGFQVGWDEQEQKITLTKASTVVELWIGQTRVTVNGKESNIDVAPKKVGDRTFVPVRFISETLGTSVQWDAQSQTVRVTSGTALLNKISKAMSQHTDQKITADLSLGMTLGDPSKVAARITMEFPIHLEMVTYHKDSLLQMEMAMPAFLGAGGDKFSVRTATKDGQVWSQDPITEAWTQKATPVKGPAQPGLSDATGISDLLKVQGEFMNKASVKIGNLETVDGVQARRIDVDLSKGDLQSIVDSLGGLKGMPQTLGGTELKTDKFVITYWVDPETLFLYKFSIDMALTMSVVEKGQKTSFDMTLKGDMHARPNLSPIQFPDFTAKALKLTPDEQRALATYDLWWNKEGDPGDCMDAADEADSYWKTKEYTAGRAASDKAAACFADKQKAYAAVTPPPLFAQIHQTIMQSLDGGAKAYTTMSQAYALAASGDTAGADAKKTDAMKQKGQAISDMTAGAVQGIKIEEKYGLSQ